MHAGRSLLLKALKLTALALVFGVNLIALAVSRGACSNSLFLLLAGLTEHGAHVLEFEFELGGFVLSDGLCDLLELFAGTAELVTETFALAAGFVDLGLQDDDATLEFDELVGEGGVLLLPVEAFALETLDGAVELSDFGAGVDDDLFGLLGGVGEEGDLALGGVDLALGGDEFVGEFVAGDDDEFVLLAGVLESFVLLISLELGATETVFEERQLAAEAVKKSGLLEKKSLDLVVTGDGGLDLA